MMGIQFSCNNCSSTLNVKEEFAGKQARCPKCQTVLTVPAADRDVALDFSSPVQERAPQQSASFDANPYAAPVASKPGPKPKGGGGSGQPTAVGPGRVIEHAFEVWKDNLGVLIGATLVVFFIGMALAFAAEFGSFMIAELGGNKDAGFLFGVFINNFLGTLMNWFLTIGLTRISLDAARGRRPEFGTLFSGANVFIAFAVAGILFGVGVLVGTLLLIIPGIIFALYFWPYSLFIVDGEATAFSSFGEASAIAKLNIGTTLVLVLASMGIALAGVLALCVGIFVAAPLISCMYASAYLMMKGEIR